MPDQSLVGTAVAAASPGAAPAAVHEGSTKRYRYRAQHRLTQVPQAGELDAASAAEVRGHLRRLGLDVLSVEPLVSPAATTVSRPAWLQAWWLGRQRQSQALVKADLLDGIATLLDAGVPLEQALGSLAAGRSRSTTERRLLMQLRDAIRAGVAPVDACAAAPTWFDPLDLALIAATQRTGDLAGTLRELGRFHHQASAIHQRIIAALIYPIILLVAGLGVWEFLSLKTLPPLITLIEQGHRTPPWLTLVVAGAGRWFALGWPLVVVSVIALVWVLRRWLRSIPMDAPWARWRFTNPWSRIQLQARCAQVAQALTRLLRAGTPLAEALDVVGAIAVDPRLARLLHEGAAAVRRGEDFSATVAASPLLDEEFAHILHLGEQSGELPTLLSQIADRYQRAAERAVDRFTAIAGPAAIVAVALLIGVVVMASVLPLVQLGDLV